MPLPPGLTLSSDGKLTGTPQAAGQPSFTVRGQDAKGQTFQQTFSLTIAGVPAYTPGTPPDFAAYPTVSSVQIGNWSDPATWGGRLPAAGDIVSVGHAVSYDVNDSTTALAVVSVRVGGTLTFRPDAPTAMLVMTLQVYGTLIIGTTAAPITSTASIIFADAPLDTTADPEQFGHGLICTSGMLRVCGQAKATFIGLAIEPKAGDTKLTLSQPATGWNVGDTVYLPDTRQLDWNQRGNNGGPYVPQWEYATVSGISADGLTITLSTALKYSHLGGHDAGGVLRYLPDVANCSRNVTIHSANPSGVRGYCYLIGRADVDMRYATFGGLGRTKGTVSVDSTTFDTHNKVTHVGTNQNSRFALTFRQLYGPATPTAGVPQFTVLGNYVTCPLSPMPFMWAVTLNDSHYGLVRDNVILNWYASGIITVTGNETDNVIDHNFTSRISGNGARDMDTSRSGTGVWLRGPNNYVTNNVANCINTGGIYCYGLGLFMYQIGGGRIPNAPGCDTQTPGQYTTVAQLNALPIKQIEGNITYGATPNGFSYWYVNANNMTPLGGPPSTIKKQICWNTYNWICFGYQSSNLTLDGWIAIGDRSLMLSGNGAQGFYFADYYEQNLAIVNADFENQYVGIPAPVQVGGSTFTVSNCVLACRADITIGALWSVNESSSGFPSRTTKISNVTHKPVLGQTARVKIQATYGTPDTTQGINIMTLDQVFVTNYDSTGKNYQVFFPQQAASYIVPQSTKNADGTTRFTGAPVAGLTNQQVWDTYVTAVAGAVMPAGTVTLAGMTGLALAS